MARRKSTLNISATVKAATPAKPNPSAAVVLLGRTLSAAARAPKKTSGVKTSVAKPASSGKATGAADSEFAVEDLRRQLVAAEARVKELEARLAQVTDRIAWIADRLHGLLDDEG